MIGPIADLLLKAAATAATKVLPRSLGNRLAQAVAALSSRRAAQAVLRQRATERAASAALPDAPVSASVGQLQQQPRVEIPEPGDATKTPEVPRDPHNARTTPADGTLNDTAASADTGPTAGAETAPAEADGQAEREPAHERPKNRSPGPAAAPEGLDLGDLPSPGGGAPARRDDPSTPAKTRESPSIGNAPIPRLEVQPGTPPSPVPGEVTPPATSSDAPETPQRTPKSLGYPSAPRDIPTSSPGTSQPHNVGPPRVPSAASGVGSPTSSSSVPAPSPPTVAEVAPGEAAPGVPRPPAGGATPPAVSPGVPQLPPPETPTDSRSPPSSGAPGPTGSAPAGRGFVLENTTITNARQLRDALRGQSPGPPRHAPASSSGDDSRMPVTRSGSPAEPIGSANADDAHEATAPQQPKPPQAPNVQPTRGATENGSVTGRQPPDATFARPDTPGPAPSRADVAPDPRAPNPNRQPGSATVPSPGVPSSVPPRTPASSGPTGPTPPTGGPAPSPSPPPSATPAASAPGSAGPAPAPASNPAAPGAPEARPGLGGLVGLLGALGAAKAEQARLADTGTKGGAKYDREYIRKKYLEPSPESVAETDAENSWIVRLSDRYARWRERHLQRKADRVPIAEQVKGLTLEERHDRLSQANALLSPEEVGKPLGVANPNIQQIVEASEARQEEQRQERQQDLSKNLNIPVLGRYLEAGMDSAKATANSMLIAAIPKLLETFADKLSESNRGLAKFNGTLAASFAAKDIAAIRSDWRTAQGTSGTGAMLNIELAKLIEETQPIRQDVARLVNLAGTGAARMAIIFTQLLKINPLLKLISSSLETLENQAKEAARKKGLPGADATRAFLQNVRDGVYARPLNPPPKKP